LWLKILVLHLEGKTHMEIVSEERIQAEGAWVEKSAVTKLWSAVIQEVQGRPRKVHNYR
jgi:hypothetical protein